MHNKSNVKISQIPCLKKYKLHFIPFISCGIIACKVFNHSITRGFSMSLKTKIARLAGRSSKYLLHRFTTGGSSLPGKLALTIDPNILTALSNNYRTIIITGTNGKTVTTGLTVNILKQHYKHVLTNPTGANMQQGIVSTFLSDAPVTDGEEKFAVLEVDEASVKHITKYISPELILVTNIFRDQMDRYGEIYTTYNLILEGVKNSPETILMMNGDAPIFSSPNVANERRYFGFRNNDKTTDMLAHYNTDGIICPECQNILHYHMITYSNLGDFFCPHCSFSRPTLSYTLDSVDKLTTESSLFTIEDEQYDLQVAGQYNIYNALAAFSIARYLDVPTQLIKKGIHSSKRIFGRQESLYINGNDVRINLIKNPVGFNQIIELIKLETEPYTLITILNDRPADGQDISWIWDGNFEDISDDTLNQGTYVSGIRMQDLQMRMKVAGFDEERLYTLKESKDILNLIRNAPANKVYVLATYTGMLDLRKQMVDQGILKERMNI